MGWQGVEMLLMAGVSLNAETLDAMLGMPCGILYFWSFFFPLLKFHGFLVIPDGSMGSF